MRKTNNLQALAGASVIAALVLPTLAGAAGNPFVSTPIAGYQLADAAQAEGKCGGHGMKTAGKAEEGKCGGKSAEGKCGGDKSAEGKCGGDKAGEGKAPEGKCGEGKCGGRK